MPWSHCPNKNVFSDRLNWPHDSPGCLRSGGKLFHTLGSSSCEGPVSETAGRPVDSKRSSVSRTHLSETYVGDELTVVDQVARSMAGQGLVDNIGGGMRFGMGGGQNHRRSRDGSLPAGSRGRASVGGLGDEVPQTLKNF